MDASHRWAEGAQARRFPAPQPTDIPHRPMSAVSAEALPRETRRAPGGTENATARAASPHLFAFASTSPTAAACSSPETSR